MVKQHQACNMSAMSGLQRKSVKSNPNNGLLNYDGSIISNIAKTTDFRIMKSTKRPPCTHSVKPSQANGASKTAPVSKEDQSISFCHFGYY